MARTTPPGIDPVPTPAPQRGDRNTFSSRVDAFIRWIVTAVMQFQAVATNVYNNAVDAFSSATSAGDSAASALISATSADRDAQTATMAPGTSATSTTSLVLGLGSKTFTLAQTGKLFKKGNTVTVATSATGNNWMSGPITAFDSGTGVMTINATNFTGSGTFADWVVSLSGAAGLTGVVNELLASSIASAATVNLTNATGNLVHITGTTTISAFTLTPGAERSVIFDGALTLTNSAGLDLPGNANLLTVPGDRALIRGDTNGAVVTHYQRDSGGPVVGGVITKEFLSGDLTISVGGSYTLAHGLSTKPKLVGAFIRCVVSDAATGAAVGDVIAVPMTRIGADDGMRLRADNTNIYISLATASGGPFSNTTLNNSNFRLFIEAFA